MKTIGLIGGMSWESTEHYYRLINEGIKKALGGLHSASVLMSSVDFHEIEQLQRNDDWDGSGKILTEKALILEKGGADFILLCTNTMHKNAPEIENALSIPFIHLADATAYVILKDNVSHVGLLGTRFTMEESFYIDRLTSKGIKVSVPPKEDIKEINRIIFDELCLGVIKDESRKIYIDVMESLVDSGAEAIIEGCTEIGNLVKSSDTKITLYDTTKIHCEVAIQKALES